VSTGQFVQLLTTVPFLTFSAQRQIAFGLLQTMILSPETSFTLRRTDVRRFRYRGIEAYV
jgi:hypothetical protein